MTLLLAAMVLVILNYNTGILVFGHFSITLLTSFVAVKGRPSAEAMFSRESRLLFSIIATALLQPHIPLNSSMTTI